MKCYANERNEILNALSITRAKFACICKV